MPISTERYRWGRNIVTPPYSVLDVQAFFFSFWHSEQLLFTGSAQKYGTVNILEVDFINALIYQDCISNVIGNSDWSE